MEDRAEFIMDFLDENGDAAMVYVWKLGGGTVGQKYEGSWTVVVSGKKGMTDDMDVRTGIHKTHFDVAVEVYEYYLMDSGNGEVQ